MNISFLNNIKLRGKLVLMSLFPLMLLGIITILLFSSVYYESSVDQSEEDLYGVASTILSAYEQNTGKYFYASNDNLWKGGYNISLSNIMLDNIKERTGNDITIIRFDKPEQEVVVTTAKNKETNEYYEYVMNETVKKKVAAGKEVFSDGVKVNKVQHYFYAIPMIQDQTENEVIGAVVASVDKSKRIAVVYNTIRTLVLISVAVIVGAIIFTILVSNSITGGLKKGFKILASLAQGKLDIDTSILDLKRKDEMGDMFKNIHNLQKSLRSIISGNIQLSNNIGENVEELNNTAYAAKDSVVYIDDAIKTVNQVSMKQGDISKRVTYDIDVLGEMIENTYSNIHELNVSNTELQKLNDRTSKVVEELNLIKETLNNIIEITSKQTRDTYELTKDIRQYAEMITNFAEETNLLALNASIEAARVGEKGKGFAIVATQIQALADQSNIVSNDITQAIKLLVDDSKRSVDTMDKVSNIIDTLNVNIEGTKEIFDVVNISVDSSINGLKQIEKQAEIMDATRGSITQGIYELDDVIRKNKKSMANTEEVKGHIDELFNKSNDIKDSTEKLLESIAKFEL